MTSINEAGITIRLPQPADLHLKNVAYLCQLVNKVYQVAEAGIWKGNVERTNIQSMFKMLEIKALLIAQMGAKPIGCINVNLFNEDLAGFGMLVTDPEYRNLGIGKKLIEAAEAWAISQRRSIMRLEILAPRNWVDSNKEFLKIWYIKMGYILQSTEDFGRLYPEKAADLATACDFAIYHKMLEK